MSNETQIMNDLWNSIARGDWVLAFGLGTSLLTRLLQAGSWLQGKIPKKYLPYVAIVLGVLGQSSAALSAGVGWSKAVSLGLVAGLVAIGSWEAALKKTPVIKKKNGTGAAVAVLFLFLVPVTGCAKDFPGRVSQTSTAIASFRQLSREAYKIKCGLVVDECKKTKSPASQPTLDDCKLWKSCDNQREKLFASASLTQMLLDSSLLVWEMGKKEEAVALFEKAKAAYENLQKLIIEYKLLEVLK